jgi:hypothetical protein
VSQHRPEYLDLCAGWALDALDDADRGRLEAHLAAGCTECERALAELSAATVALVSSLPESMPSRRLMSRVMSVATTTPGARKRRKHSLSTAARPRVREFSWTWVPIAAAAALTLVTALLWVRGGRLQDQLAVTRQRVADLEQRLTADREWNRILASAQARVAQLAPTTDGDPRLRARVVYDPGSQRAIVMCESMVPPSGRDYELWVIRDGAPVSLGVIRADETGRADLRIENVGVSSAISAFAVSMEPTGGSLNKNAPSGPVVMLGPLGS